jgi:hypothetical protein
MAAVNQRAAELTAALQLMHPTHVNKLTKAITYVNGCCMKQALQIRTDMV